MCGRFNTICSPLTSSQLFERAWQSCFFFFGSPGFLHRRKVNSEFGLGQHFRASRACSSEDALVVPWVASDSRTEKLQSVYVIKCMSRTCPFGRSRNMQPSCRPCTSLPDRCPVRQHLLFITTVRARTPDAQLAGACSTKYGALRYFAGTVHSFLEVHPCSLADPSHKSGCGTTSWALCLGTAYNLSSQRGLLLIV